MSKKIVFLIPPILHFIASFLIPFTYWPEMLNWPFFISRNWLPYQDFIMIHTPTLPYLLSLFYKLFGFELKTLHLFGSILLSLTNLILMIFIYKETKKLLIAQVLGILFIYFSLAFEGNTVWFESLLTPIFIGILWCQLSFLDYPRKSKIIILGILAGISLLIKQTALYLFPEMIIFFICIYLRGKINFNELIKLLTLYFSPIIIILTIFIALLNHWNLLSDFLYWGVNYVVLKPFIGKAPDGYLLLPTKGQSLILFFLVAVSLFQMLVNKNIKIFFAFLAMLSSLFLAFPRFGYFHLLPFIALFLILLGISLESINGKRIYAFLSLLPVVILSGFVLSKTLRYSHTFVKPETMDISRLIKQNYVNKSLFILNGPDQIYFLTQKMPAFKPWIPQLPWYLDFYGDKFHQDFIVSPPDIIVYSVYLDKPVGGLGAYQPEKVVENVFSHYKIVKTFPNGTKLMEKI